jgi:hypothetical protein
MRDITESKINALNMGLNLLIEINHTDLNLALDFKDKAQDLIYRLGNSETDSESDIPLSDIETICELALAVRRTKIKAEKLMQEQENETIPARWNTDLKDAMSRLAARCKAMRIELPPVPPNADPRTMIRMLREDETLVLLTEDSDRWLSLV